MRELGNAALGKESLKIDLSTLAETNQFLSDTRYLIGAIAVPRGTPLFRWNESKTVTRETALKEWVKQGGPCLEPLLTGCAFETLLADAYHAACRTADMASRPYSLRASVAFLQTTFGQTRRVAARSDRRASTTSGSKNTVSVSDRATTTPSTTA